MEKHRKEEKAREKEKRNYLRINGIQMKKHREGERKHEKKKKEITPESTE